jgi:hypothetical protein
MMIVNLYIALCTYVEVKQTVGGKKGQHVVEKAHIRTNFKFTTAIKVQCSGYLSLFCFPFQIGFTLHRGVPFSRIVCVYFNLSQYPAGLSAGEDLPYLPLKSKTQPLDLFHTFLVYFGKSLDLQI